MNREDIEKAIAAKAKAICTQAADAQYRAVHVPSLMGEELEGMSNDLRWAMGRIDSLSIIARNLRQGLYGQSEYPRVMANIAEQ